MMTVGYSVPSSFAMVRTLILFALPATCGCETKCGWSLGSLGLPSSDGQSSSFTYDGWTAGVRDTGFIPFFFFFSLRRHLAL